MTHGVSDFLTTFFSEKTSLFFILLSVKMQRDGNCLVKSTWKGKRKAYFLQPNKPQGIARYYRASFLHTCQSTNIQMKVAFHSNCFTILNTYIYSLLDDPCRPASPSRRLSLP